MPSARHDRALARGATALAQDALDALERVVRSRARGRGRRTDSTVARATSRSGRSRRRAGSSRRVRPGWRGSSTPRSPRRADARAAGGDSSACAASACTSAASARGVLERGLHVHLAHLDGSEPRMRAHVPPDERVVVEVPRRPRRPAPSQHTRPSRETKRGHSAARIRAHDREARARQAGVRAEPVRAVAPPVPAAAGGVSRSPFSIADRPPPGPAAPTCTCSAHSGVRRIRLRIVSSSRR